MGCAENTFSFWISLRMCDILTFRASSSSSGTCGTVSGSTSSGLWKVSSVRGMHHLLSYCWFFLERQEQHDGKRQDKIAGSTFGKKNQSFTIIWRKITEKINCFCLCGLKFNFLFLTSINNNVPTEVHLYVSQEPKSGCLVGTDLITKEKNRKVLVKRGLNDGALQVRSGGPNSRDVPADMARLLWFQQKTGLQGYQATVLTSRMSRGFLDYCDCSRCIM